MPESKPEDEDDGKKTKEAWRDRVFAQMCHQHPKAQKKYIGPPLPPLANLIYPRKTNMDEIRDRIPKPDGYLPRMHMPSWVDRPLDRKLPNVELDNFYYTRGKLNETLHRSDRKMYANVDPYNIFNHLPDDKYNALHDPSTARYFNRPSVRKLITDQGLITPDGEVLCSQKEINNFRHYLQKYQNNNLTTEFNTEGDKTASQKAMVKELRAYVTQRDDSHRVRLEFMLEKNRLTHEDRLRTLKAKIRDDKRRLEKQQEVIRQAWESRKKASERCNEYQKAQRDILRQQRERERVCNHIAQLEKQARAELMHDLSDMRRNLLLKVKQAEHVVAKSEYQKRELLNTKMMMERLQKDHETKQMEYDERMEKNRMHYPIWAEKRKENERHIIYLMRKFLDMWKDYVKRRKARRADPAHQSAWDVGNTTKDSVHELQDLSGLEKFDNFILNLIQMKRAMAKEIEFQKANPNYKI